MNNGALLVNIDASADPPFRPLARGGIKSRHAGKAILSYAIVTVKPNEEIVFVFMFSCIGDSIVDGIIHSFVFCLDEANVHSIVVLEIMMAIRRYESS